MSLGGYCMMSAFGFALAAYLIFLTLKWDVVSKEQLFDIYISTHNMLQSMWRNFAPQRSSVVLNKQYVTIKVHLKNNVLEKKNSCAAPE